MCVKLLEIHVSKIFIKTSSKTQHSNNAISLPGAFFRLVGHLIEHRK